MPRTSVRNLYDTPLYPQRRIISSILSQSTKKPHQPRTMNQKQKARGGGEGRGREAGARRCARRHISPPLPKPRQRGASGRPTADPPAEDCSCTRQPEAAPRQDGSPAPSPGPLRRSRVIKDMTNMKAACRPWTTPPTSPAAGCTVVESRIAACRFFLAGICLQG